MELFFVNIVNSILEILKKVVKVGIHGRPSSGLPLQTGSGSQCKRCRRYPIAECCDWVLYVP